MPSGGLIAPDGTLAGKRLVGSHQIFVRDRKQIIDLAVRHRLPAMYEWREQVADGGLMTYSTSPTGINQRVASYVDRMLKGVKPGDLPVERRPSSNWRST